jgi:F-type H+-transporting ATPase subunit b
MELHDFKFFTLETLIIQFIILAIIIWVLNTYVFKPYLKYLDREETRRKKLEQDYKNIDKLLASANQEKELLLSEARTKSDNILIDSEMLAKKKKEEILLKADEDAKEIINSAKTEIEKERLSMLNSIKSKVTDLVLQFNSKLFKQEKLSRDFVENELDNMKI